MIYECLKFVRSKLEWRRMLVSKDLCIGIIGLVMAKCCLRSPWNGFLNQESQIFLSVSDGLIIAGQLRHGRKEG